ncbi:hypothetical protein DFP72DRAFT_1061852 [Ephemerocybe angulata]|nr:hypothetical protein DFP72DRAFT_1061852 [Tulosesus angulatus]
MDPLLPSSNSAPASATTSTSHSPAPSLPASASDVSSVIGSNPQTPPPPNSASGDAAVDEQGTIAGTSPDSNSSSRNPTTSASPAEEDKQIIIEALKSKDRIYVLKLGEQMESMIKERRQRVDLNPTTSYQRLLVHRCSAYYKLSPETDSVNKGIFVLPTAESRIPDVRICELVPPESSSQPTFKIMRRSASDRRTKPRSQAGSVAGEDADLSDVEPSEAGSLGGRSNATGGSKKHMSIAEREAAYQEARNRIFMDFEEKEKTKESQMSASSSSLSLNSASASTSANGDASSAGDVDGSISSPTTESEWSAPSGPAPRERKDNRRGNASASSSSRSARSGGASYGSNNSSRNSRASSPSFTYASLYEPAPQGQLYDPSQPPSTANPNPSQSPYGTQYYHPFAPPPQPAGGVYIPQYPYYAPYPYQPPPPDPHHNNPDSSQSRGIEQYPQHAMAYAAPYMWAPAHPTSAPHSLPTSPHHPLPPSGHGMSPTPVQAQPYGYVQQPAYTYPQSAYYPLQQTPQGQAMAPPPPPSGMQNPMYDHSRTLPPGQSGNGTSSAPPHSYQAPFSHSGRGGLGNGAVSHQQPARNQRNNPGLPGNGNKRNAPVAGRGAWSYGPGIGSGYNPSPGSMGGDAVGPRLTTSRRQSNNSASSSYSRASSNNDDVSSIASSSTTSSSSRRTYTSTASSQHPLPPRPDWAVGLKAQPTLASRESPSRHPSLPISPSRSANGSTHSLSRKTPPLSLQPNDFPPLTPQAASQEKRPTIPNGAWGNAANRSILSPPGGARSDDGERGSERTSPKGGEGSNPRRWPASAADEASGGAPLGNNNTLTEQLVNQIQSISIEEKIAAVELASTNSMMAIPPSGQQPSGHPSAAGHGLA